MDFFELSGTELMTVLNDDEFQPEELRRSGVNDDSQVRINRHGDIEVLKGEEWEVIGGLLGDFAHRLERKTGREWHPQES